MLYYKLNGNAKSGCSFAHQNKRLILFFLINLVIWVTINFKVRVRGGVLEDVLGLEDTFSSPWPWP